MHQIFPIRSISPIKTFILLSVNNLYIKILNYSSELQHLPDRATNDYFF